jgi:hypothetical protein
MTRRTIVGAAVLAAMALAGRDAGAQASGTWTHNGTAMPVKAAVAIWDAKRPALKVHFLPFEPSAQETAALQKNDTFWLLDKPGSDPKKWPATPHGSITLSWTFDPKSAGTLAKAWADVYAFGIARPNSNLNSSLTEGELKGTLTGPVKDGSTVTFTSAGEVSFEKDKLAWDVKVTTKVLPALAR